MPTLFLMVGAPGSGKTTWAKRIEAERRALRLAPDEWMSRIVGDGYDWPRRQAVHEVQWGIAERALRLGLDVVLENGFFRRADRDDYRTRAAAVGAEARVWLCDAPRDVLLARIQARNADLPPDTFPVSEAHLDDCLSWLERPEDDELQIAAPPSTERARGSPG